MKTTPELYATGSFSEGAYLYNMGFKLYDKVKRGRKEFIILESKHPKEDWTAEKKGIDFYNSPFSDFMGSFQTIKDWSGFGYFPDSMAGKPEEAIA